MVRIIFWYVCCYDKKYDKVAEALEEKWWYFLDETLRLYKRIQVIIYMLYFWWQMEKARFNRRKMDKRRKLIRPRIELKPIPQEPTIRNKRNKKVPHLHQPVAIILNGPTRQNRHLLPRATQLLPPPAQSLNSLRSSMWRPNQTNQPSNNISINLIVIQLISLYVYSLYCELEG